MDQFSWHEDTIFCYARTLLRQELDSVMYFCFMSKGAAWIQAMRLRTLPLSLSGIIAGSAVAYYNGFWNGFIFALAITTTVLFQILSNLANDLGDGIKGTDNDNRVGPERAVQSGVISPKAMKNGVVLTSILSLISASLLIYLGTQNMPASMIWFYAILAILCVIAAITYTVGKSAYGYHGLGDLMVLLFFGGVSVLGVYSLYAKAFLNENILLALSIGLLSTAVLNLNNMRDFQNDQASGKITLVVRIGPNFAKLYHVFIVMLAIGCFGQFVFLVGNPILFVAMAPALILIVHLRKAMRVTDPKDFDPELKKVALATFALSVFLFVGLILVKHYGA